MACSAPKYEDQTFWQDAFVQGIYGHTYEWVADVEVLSHVLQPLVNSVPGGASECRVLHLGCGNSELPEQLYDNFGIRRCTNIDFSAEVIHQMRERNAKTRPELTWLVGDCTDLTQVFADGEHFDLILEKGLLDAMACTKKREDRNVKFVTVLRQVVRLLPENGVFIFATVDPVRFKQLTECYAYDGQLPGLRLDQSVRLPPPPDANPLLWPANAKAFVLRRVQLAEPQVAQQSTIQLCSPDNPSENLPDRAIDHYGCGPKYWDDRYSQKTERLPFDWLRHYEHIADLIGEVTNGNFNLQFLEVGCGNSELSEKMYDAGYRNIVCVDSSSVVIDMMTRRNAQRAGLRWLHMDATCMDFSANSFDVVIDKSLTDTFACLPVKERHVATAAYLGEVQRVLRPGGQLLCISLAEQRHAVLKDAGFVVDCRILEPARRVDGRHFAYICQTFGSEPLARATHLDSLD